MKILNLFAVVFLCFFLFSCKKIESIPYDGVDFLFKEIQPVDDKEITNFPNRFQGIYINSDSTYLIVSKKDVYYKWIDKNKISFEMFNSFKDSLKQVQNRLYFKDNSFLEYRKLKDSVEINEIKYDTIFSIFENQKAVKINRTFVLNTKDSIYWGIRLMTFNKNNLQLKDIYSLNDLRRIDSISEIKSVKIDSTKNLFQLTRKEFKSMLVLKNFGFEKSYRKVN